MNFLKSMLFIWTFELQIHFSEKKGLLVCFVTYIFLKLAIEIVMHIIQLYMVKRIMKVIIKT